MKQSPTIEPSAEEIQAAAWALSQGLLVAFPTETVYGLGADAENTSAVAHIYTTKERPSNHPVIVHVAPDADLHYWAKELPEAATKLIAAFWPGPLTLIVKRADHIPDTVSGGQDSIGIRCPSHPVAQKLLRAFSDLKGGHGGVAAPSANKFGHVSPTTAEHVREEFVQELKSQKVLAHVLDGGQSEVGIESTILDVSRLASHGAVLLRPGHITLDQLSAVLGFAPNTPDASAPRASGTLEAHYAPVTPVAIIAQQEMLQVMMQLHQAEKRFAVISHDFNHAHVNNLLEQGQRGLKGLKGLVAQQIMPQNAIDYAHDLYAALRAMDHVNADIILIAELPQDKAWQGVNDRLRRAAFDSRAVLQSLFSAK